MPYYDYECTTCGPFTEVRPMAQSAAPCTCPDCGQMAPRAILTVPNYAMMDAGKRHASSTNERASHEPKSSKQHTSGHGPGCSCCGGGKKKSRAIYRPDGSKTFPSARPWMISH
ncbi:zinc ribbon domain-containing protein [uncultured Thalassospira sp.]|jgi:putative FmdB family regulatory protein|uniref:FmdB family zinc ribbon protein n=1 Tax=uncultured Thalassospira sp. TaxID=404382 RepID=UPI0030DCCBFA|tara:strand:+ start:942 stop:1283 length:342 start_codon:yes stop_codon:yes gene_type:complete